MKGNRSLVLFLLLILISASVYSQTSPFADTLKALISPLDSIRMKMPVEKVYIQTDKPYYTSGDTIWLKAYLFDAVYLRSSARSGILYLELANDTGKVLDRRMLPLFYGIGIGNIVLNKEDIPQGSYTLRAYTNWMRNFGEDYVFKKSFFISDMTSSWLVSSAIQHSRDPVATGKESIRMALRFRQLNGNAVGLHDIQLRLMDGKKTLLRNNFQTSAEGKLDLNFALPDKTDTKNIALLAEDMAKGQESRKIPIPVPVNRLENMDLQFMPEGGNLVTGIASRIGFKAISEDGKGIDVSGKVYRGDTEVASFASSHKGMGSFRLIPEAGQIYTAKVSLPDGTIKSYPLPAVKSSGVVLRIDNSKENDSLEVNIYITSDLLVATPVYYLIGQSSGPGYASSVKLTGRWSVIKLPKNIFLTGIARFTLFTANRQPVSERITYIDLGDNLRIKISPDKPGYTSRDSIALAIEVKDKEGKPVRGSFSLAVTDDSQVRTDSTAANILTSLLLTSDLKGTIEDPGYYFDKRNEQAWEQLNDLLLTQGWVGYDWENVFSPAKPPAYEAEPEFIIKGRVSNILNNSLPGTGIRLFSTRPLVIRDTLTDSQGLFRFKSFPALDTARFLIQAKNKNDKSFNVGIEVEEFKPPVFKPSTQRFAPWYLNSDTTLLRNINTRITQQKALEKLPSGENMLQEVTIIGKKVIKGSYNLNGPGEADQTLDEKELQKAGKLTLLQLLEQRINGFGVGMFPTVGRSLDDLWNQVVPGRIRHIEEVMKSDTLVNVTKPVSNPGRLPDIPVPVLNGPDKLRAFLIPKLSYMIKTSLMRLIIDGIDVDDPYEIVDITSQKERYEYIKGFLDFYTAEDIKGIEVMYNMQYNARYSSRITSYEQQLLSSGGLDYAYIEVTTYSGKGPFMKKTPGTYFYKPLPFASRKQFYSPEYKTKSVTVQETDLRSTIHWDANIITDPEGKAKVSFYSADRPGTYTVIMEGSDLNGSIGYRQEKIKISSK